MMYNNYMGGFGGVMVFFGAVIWLLVIINLVLTIGALWKYINKK